MTFNVESCVKSRLGLILGFLALDLEISVWWGLEPSSREKWMWPRLNLPEIDSVSGEKTQSVGKDQYSNDQCNGVWR